VLPPRLETAYHLLGVKVRVNSQAGTSSELYCDHLYTMVLVSDEAEWEIESAAPTIVLHLDRGQTDLPEQAFSRLLDSCVKSHVETLVFRKAEQCEAIPAGLETTAVSAFCHYGDSDSALRRGNAESPFSDWDRWPRTNLPQVLSVLKHEARPIWKFVSSQLEQLAQSENDPPEPLCRKARFVQQAVQADHTRRQTVRSSVTQ
jgi:hypothetical protein